MKMRPLWGFLFPRFFGALLMACFLVPGFDLRLVPGTGLPSSALRPRPDLTGLEEKLRSQKESKGEKVTRWIKEVYLPWLKGFERILNVRDIALASWPQYHNLLKEGFPQEATELHRGIFELGLRPPDYDYDPFALGYLEKNIFNRHLFVPLGYYVHLERGSGYAGRVVDRFAEETVFGEKVEGLVLDLWWAEPSAALHAAGGDCQPGTPYAVIYGSPKVWKQEAGRWYSRFFVPSKRLWKQWRRAWPQVQRGLELPSLYQDFALALWDVVRRRSGIIQAGSRQKAISLLADRLRRMGMAEELQHARDGIFVRLDVEAYVKRIHPGLKEELVKREARLAELWMKETNMAKVADAIKVSYRNHQPSQKPSVDLVLRSAEKLVRPTIVQRPPQDRLESLIQRSTIYELSAHLRNLSSGQMQYPSLRLAYDLWKFLHPSIWLGGRGLAYMRGLRIYLDAMIEQVPGSTFEEKADCLLQQLREAPDFEEELRRLARGAEQKLLRSEEELSRILAEDQAAGLEEKRFVGQGLVTLDDKNRWLIPARWRDRFQAGAPVFVRLAEEVVGQERYPYVEVYPPGAQAPDSEGWQEIRMGSKGRLLLGAAQLERMGLSADRKYAVLGMGDHLELWQEASLKAVLEGLDLGSLELQFPQRQSNFIGTAPVATGDRNRVLIPASFDGIRGDALLFIRKLDESVEGNSFHILQILPEEKFSATEEALLTALRGFSGPGSRSTRWLRAFYPAFEPVKLDSARRILVSEEQGWASWLGLPTDLVWAGAGSWLELWREDSWKTFSDLATQNFDAWSKEWHRKRNAAGLEEDLALLIGA